MLLLLCGAGHALAQDAADSGKPSYGERYFLELGFGFGRNGADDKFDRRLRDADFERTGIDETRVTVAVGYRLHPNFAFGLNYLNFNGANWQRGVDNLTQGYAWHSRGFGAFAQADVGVGPKRGLNAFVRGGLGLAFGSAGFDAVVVEAANADSNPDLFATPGRTHRVTDRFSSYFLSASVGLAFAPTDNVAFQVEIRESYVPGLQNAFGERHDLGGLAGLFELHLRSWE